MLRGLPGAGAVPIALPAAEHRIRVVVPDFKIEVDRGSDGGARVVVIGELDLAVASDFRDRVAELLTEGSVLLDLRGLEFMDSSGIRALDALLRLAEAEGHSLLQVSSTLQPPVRQVLELTGMLGVLSLVEAEGAG